MFKLEYPLISIQILNWNRAEETQRAIASAYAQTYPNIEVVMVDNGSTDNSVNLTGLNYPNVKIVELGRNYGCPGGRNRGIPFCEGDYIFYLDNDGVLHEDAVLNAFRSIISSENIAIVAGSVYSFEDESEIDTRCSIVEKVEPTVDFQGGVTLHLKRIYEEVGYYPDHFIYGSEELFLALQVLDRQYKIVKNHSVILWHKRSLVQRDRPRELLNGYYNKLYTAVALYPAFEMVAFIFYFVFVYPIYAYRSKVLGKYLMSFIPRFFSTLKAGLQHRNPITKLTYKIFKSSR